MSDFDDLVARAEQERIAEHESSQEHRRKFDAERLEAWNATQRAGAQWISEARAKGWPAATLIRAEIKDFDRAPVFIEVIGQGWCIRADRMERHSTFLLDDGRLLISSHRRRPLRKGYWQGKNFIEKTRKLPRHVDVDTTWEFAYPSFLTLGDNLESMPLEIARALVDRRANGALDTR